MSWWVGTILLGHPGTSGLSAVVICANESAAPTQEGADCGHVGVFSSMDVVRASWLGFVLSKEINGTRISLLDVLPDFEQ